MTQRTLKKRVDIVGVGLHTGQRTRLQILPAPANSGVTFVRSDLGGASLRVPEASISRVDHATTLSGDLFVVSTVEHLMAGLLGLGVDNATVCLSGDEVPIMDGSAAPFVYLLREAGLKDLGQPRRYIQMRRPVSTLDGDREVTIYPADHFRITYTIDFAHPAIGRQSLSRTMDERTFVNQIAPARTFCLLKDVQQLRRRGLALGGSLANAVVIGDAGPLNSLRYDDEPVRHKALDLIGDLALLGYPILGHVVAHKAGHEMHARLLREILAQPDSWRLTDGVPAAARPQAQPVAVAHPRAASGLQGY